MDYLDHFCDSSVWHGPERCWCGRVAAQGSYECHRGEHLPAHEPDPEVFRLAHRETAAYLRRIGFEAEAVEHDRRAAL